MFFYVCSFLISLLFVCSLCPLSLPTPPQLGELHIMSWSVSNLKMSSHYSEKELHSGSLHHHAADAALTWLNGAPATMADHSSTFTSPC
jgi:hypothetical protein